MCPVFDHHVFSVIVWTPVTNGNTTSRALSFVCWWSCIFFFYSAIACVNIGIVFGSIVEMACGHWSEKVISQVDLFCLKSRERKSWDCFQWSVMIFKRSNARASVELDVNRWVVKCISVKFDDFSRDFQVFHGSWDSHDIPYLWEVFQIFFVTLTLGHLEFWHFETPTLFETCQSEL